MCLRETMFLYGRDIRNAHAKKIPGILNKISGMKQHECPP